MAREPLVQDRQPLNEVKFAGRDFGSIFDALMRRLKIQYADIYNDYAESSVGIMLVDLCAHAAAQICWTLDRIASDCYLATVRTPTPASWLSRMVGYKMTPAAAAGADLTLSFDSIPGPATMGTGWRFMGPESIQYELVADLALVVSGVPVTYTASVRQGETRNLSYVGDGTLFQQYTLEYAGADEYIADGSVRVWVDGAEWTEETFLAYEATDQFEVDYLAEPPYVRFGDGKAGNVPNDGADIRIEFVKIVGAKGNVKADTITTSLDTLTIGGVPVPFTVTNALPARSGMDAETVDHARRTAPYAFAARGGAITLTDYQAQANGYVDALYGAVAKAYAYSPHTAYADIVFNGYVAQIGLYLDDFDLAIAAVQAAWAADLVTINAQVTAIDDAYTNMEAERAAAVAAVAAIVATCESANGTLLVNDGSYSSLGTAYTAHTGASASLLAYLATVLSPAELVIATGYITTMDASADTMKAAADAISGNDAAARAMITGTIQMQNAALDAIVEDTTGTWEVELAAQAAAVAALAVPIANVTAQIAAADVLATDLNADITAQTTQMQLRVGELFDASCRANIVQVPILSVDANGDYIAPPSGLMASLQTHLDGLKEVTQQVEVLDGTPGLLDTDITIRTRVSDGYVVAEVLSAIDATVRGIMRGREFAAPLYLSYLYQMVRACSAGVEYCTITILTDPLAYTIGGNAIPEATQILVLRTLDNQEAP